MPCGKVCAAGGPSWGASCWLDGAWGGQPHSKPRAHTSGGLATSAWIIMAGSLGGCHAAQQHLLEYSLCGRHRLLGSVGPLKVEVHPATPGGFGACNSRAGGQATEQEGTCGRPGSGQDFWCRGSSAQHVCEQAQNAVAVHAIPMQAESVWLLCARHANQAPFAGLLTGYPSQPADITSSLHCPCLLLTKTHWLLPAPIASMHHTCLTHP